MRFIRTATLLVAHSLVFCSGILAALCCGLQPGQFREAGRALGVYRETVAAHVNMLGELIQTNELRGEYLQLRGLVRQKGVLSATPVSAIEEIQHYFHEASTALPGAHDVVVNPTDRSEKKQKHALFGPARKHHERFLHSKRKQQQQQWGQEQIVHFDTGSNVVYAVSTLLHRACDPSFMLVSVLGQARKFNSVDDCVLQVRPLAIYRLRL